jgi:hypothetical protein
MMVLVHVVDDTSLCRRIFGCLITHIVIYGFWKIYLERNDDINVSWLATRDPEDQITERSQAEAPLLTRWSKVVTCLRWELS